MFCTAGLNAGDEILQLNGKSSCSLNFSDMKVAFSQASLALTVSTLPSVDRRQLCYLPPRRSDVGEDLYTDIFSQSQGESHRGGGEVPIRPGWLAGREIKGRVQPNWTYRYILFFLSLINYANCLRQPCYRRLLWFNCVSWLLTETTRMI